MKSPQYDALLLVSFGGPEGPDDVLPFLDNVLRGRNVPQARKEEVAEHYYLFGGVSPINQQNRELIQAIEAELARTGTTLPVYWGNRNWHPLLADTIRQMKEDGITRSLALITSAFSSYSACRQYLEAIAEIRGQEGPAAPQISKLRCFFNHPRFVEAWCERASEGLRQFAAHDPTPIHVLFTAHSIPLAMAEACQYVAQLNELAALIARQLQLDRSHWHLVYQSRSGPPQQPWLAPDVCDALRDLRETGAQRVLLVPIGFLSDHIEVLYDLDVEAVDTARQCGIELARARTIGTHPQFVIMIRELIEERMGALKERPTVGVMGAAPDECPPDCCRYAPSTRP
jgi:protoporphyrin/coproporphyrin ferrochelatase